MKLLEAQPLAPPNLLRGSGPDWLGAAVAAFAVGGIVFIIFQRIGRALSYRTFKPFWERFWERSFTLAGFAIWLVIFYVFIFVL